MTVRDFLRSSIARWRARLLAAAAILLMAVSTSAQGPITLEGTIRDATGAAIQGVRVEARQTGPAAHTAVTDTAGRYQIEGLAPGRYTVTAEHVGFRTEATTVEVSSANRTADLTLSTLTASESVTVAGVGAPAALDVPTGAASRIGLTARETPATIEVITFAEAQERGLRTSIETLSSVAGVSSAFLPSAQGITQIRGFTGGAVSMLFDGTRVTTSTMVTRNYDSWSFERIEVLKGPASVLFGEGALAGAVNYVPKRPDFGTRHGEVLVSYGSLETSRLAADATGPLANGRAAYRAGIVFNRSGSYIEDSANDNLSLSGGVDVRLGASGTLALAIDHFRDDYGSAYFGTPIVARASARQPSDLVSDSRGFVLDEAMRDRNYDVNGGITDIRTTWGRARLEWPISPVWKMTNDFYVYDKQGDWKNAEVYTFAPASGLLTRSTVSISHDHQFWGDRLALSSDARFGHRRNRFTIGLEANRNDLFSPRRFGSTTPVDPYDPVRGAFPADTPENFPGAGNRQDFDSTINLISVFVEDALTVAPRVTLIGGLRTDRFDVDRSVDDLNTGLQTAFSRSFHPVSGRAGVVVDVLPKTQLFGQYTSAVAPVATVLLISQANAAFDLTTGDSWEGGVKSTVAGGRVDATASVFKIVQDDIVTRDPNNFNIAIQGGTQATTGVEMSVSVNAARGVRLTANAAFMDPRFVTLVEAGGLDRAGNLPPNVPERTAGLWIYAPVGRSPLTIGGGIRYQSRFFTNNANSTEVAGFTLVDAQASWRLARGEITLRGRNLTDALYADWTGASANQVQLGAPRTFDIGYHVRFR
jgi:iron complex outermembrane receptor protein